MMFGGFPTRFPLRDETPRNKWGGGVPYTEGVPHKPRPVHLRRLGGPTWPFRGRPRR